MTRKRTLVSIAVVLIASCVAVGSAGGRSSSTSVTVVLRPLIGTSTNEIQQVTFGGKIGFGLDVSNTGTSTVNHVVIVVDSDAATFSDASSSACAKDPQYATRMVCKLQQMQGGTGFSVDLRFTAPTSGSSVVTTPSVTVDAKTQGSSGNNGTQTVTGASVTTALVSSAANALVKTFAKGKEAVATSSTLPQHSKFTMPDALGSLYGVDTSVEETTGTPLCDKCPKYVTILEIPDSLTASSPFSPTNPFSFTVTLLPAGEPKGYNPTGLYHDRGLVPMCADSPLSATVHICLDSFQVGKKTGIVAIGRAYQNGRLGFG
ncbi:MAG TPA: hypothetical protein VH816_12310 [Gaiellaceae bacterium]|jgi:hypothetical protein